MTANVSVTYYPMHMKVVPQLALLAQRASRWRGARATAMPLSECAVGSVSSMSASTLLSVGLVVATYSGMRHIVAPELRRGKGWRGEGAYVSGLERTSSSAPQQVGRELLLCNSECERLKIRRLLFGAGRKSVESLRHTRGGKGSRLEPSTELMRHDAG